MSELLIGCGRRRDKFLYDKKRKKWDGLVTLDINPGHNPDVVHDLEELPYPFEDNQFSEIHAYEVLEHTGRQGDYRFFFAQFSEFWRILEPDGVLYATVPLADSPWAWGDPSHTRIISNCTLAFLDQAEYKAQIGVTAMTDFRYLYKADFDPIYLQKAGDSFHFALKAIKPSRHGA